MHITAGRGISTSKNIEIRIIATDPVDMTWIRLYERLIAFIHRIVIFSIHVQYVFGKPMHVEIFIMKLLFNFCMEFYILLRQLKNHIQWIALYTFRTWCM